MIAAASIEVGELGPVVVSISNHDGKYHYNYREFDLDQEALDHYHGLVPSKGYTHDGGYLYIRNKPDNLCVNLNDNGGYVKLRYGDHHMSVVAAKDVIKDITRDMLDKM
jgi:hypothetical protein